MEAYSVEDKGDGICFNVFVYNVQPQITIDYATGESSYNGATIEPDDHETQSASYMLNKNTKRFISPLAIPLNIPPELNCST